jgi:RHS repeat-associated protein
METTAGSSYYTADALGSTILITNSSGTAAATYTYDTWGTTNTATGTLAAANPWRYATGYTDTSGLIKLGTRYYNPALGRFTQQDPARQSDNPYIYAGDSPVNLDDPTGRYWGEGVVDDVADNVAGAAENGYNDAVEALPLGGLLGAAGGAIDGCLATLEFGCAGGAAAGAISGGASGAATTGAIGFATGVLCYEIGEDC